MVRTVKTVLVGVDFGRGSERLVARAEEFAAAFGARLVLLNVAVAMEDVVDLNMAFVEYDERAVDLQARAKKELERFAREHLAGTAKTELRISHGKPHEQLLKLAEELPADLLVVGTHGEKGLERVVYGSPAHALVQAAKMPVLVVPLQYA